MSCDSYKNSWELQLVCCSSQCWQSFHYQRCGRVFLLCFFCTSFWCDCGVVMYRKSQCTTIYSAQNYGKSQRVTFCSPQNSPKTWTSCFLACLTTTKPFIFPSACSASLCQPTHPHQLGMGGNIGRPPPEHPEQLVAWLQQWWPQSRPYCSHKLECLKLVQLPSWAQQRA